MRDKKTYIILMVVLVVFFLVMFIAFGIQRIKEKGQEGVFIVGNTSIFAYSKGKWNTIKSIGAIDKLNWEKYQIYLNNKKFGSYYLWSDDKWYAFDEDKNAVALDGNMLAYNANYNVKIYDYTLENIEENNKYVMQVLEDNNIALSSKFTSSSKIAFDFDNDGIVEEFYLITNAFPLDFHPEVMFSIVFMVKNDTIYSIYTDVGEGNSVSGCKPFFNTFLDYNDDNKYEFVLSCGKYSISEQIDMLYRFMDNQFKIVISNQ